jgi:cell wall-associated NlpC family hydrolase
MTLDVGIANALASALVPVRDSRAAKTRPEFYLDVVVKSGLDVSVADAITGGELERTMDGASTLTLTLHDPHRALLRNPDLAKAIDMTFGGYWWRLVKVSKSGDALTLTFEDRDVAYLRQHAEPRKAYRGTVTRAEFIRQLVREVGQRPATKNRKATWNTKRIAFVCPELSKVQPIGAGEKTKAPAPRRDADREDNRQPGLNPKARLTVKGARATAEQRRNGERVLDVADELNAGPKATLALMEAVIMESTIRNLSYGDADSIGILQLQVHLHGYAVASSIEKSVHGFLAKGFTGAGGAIKLAREHSGWTAAQVAQGVQGAGVNAYAQAASEAQEWLDAYGGASGSDTGGTSSSGSSRAKKRYAFRRGEPGKPEDSWTAIQRLAEEVQWRAFMDRGRLFYVSDDWLRRQKPRFIISEDDDGVDEINFDIDSGKVSSDVTVTAHAATFQVPVGCVVQVRECGIANGRYLAKSVRQSIYDHACEITLSAATPKLPEPEAEDVSASARGSQARDATVTGGSLRDRIVAVAKASADDYRRNSGAWFYSQAGASYYQDPTKPPKRGTRSDCSHWVCCVYKKAGAPPPGSAEIGATGTMATHGHFVPTSQAKPGDVILYGSGSFHHVEIYVGPGQATIGHGSPPVDPGSVGMIASPHCYRYDFLD